MLAPKFTLRDDFAPVDYREWREVAEASLNGASIEQKLVTHTYEGVDLQPLYTRQDQLGEGDVSGFPGMAPFVRGARPLGNAVAGWEVCQDHAHPCLKTTAQAIADDVAGGVGNVLLRFDQAGRTGLDPDGDEAADLAGRDGIMLYNVDDLELLLAGVDCVRNHVALDAGAAFLPAAALLAAYWQRRQIASDTVRASFYADPLGTLASDGRLPQPAEIALQQLAALARWTDANFPRVTAVAVDTSVYHHAGATAAQDLGFAMATGVAYLRALTAGGLDVARAARQIVFRLSVGTHHFLALAKLRAARRLWYRVLETCNAGPDAAAMRIHARTSRRVLTRRDPYVNMLRNTAATFAAGLGGADVITSVPFDELASLPDDFSRRVARNTLLILQEEAQLHRVVDPAGGSWFLEKLTDQLAAAGWEVFQQAERAGGMLDAICSGWVGEQIDVAFAPRAKNIARRKEGITGVSEFPDVHEEQVARDEPDLELLREKALAALSSARPADMAALDGDPAAACAAAVSGASLGQLATALGFHTQPVRIQPLAFRTFAQPYEALRDASDAWVAAHGARPRVFLANLGPVAHHTARATYAKNFFEAGGFDVVSNNGFATTDEAADAFRASGARIAVICSSDKLYPDFVPQAGPALKGAGARTVVLAGHPQDNEDAWRAAGVDRFIFIRCDVLQILRELLHEEGVLTS